MKRKMTGWKKLFGKLGLIILTGLSAISVQAQKADTVSKKWHFVAEPYLFMVNLSGTTAVKNIPPMEVSVPFSKLIENLKMAGFLYLEVHNDRFAISSDVLYSNLQKDAVSKNGIVSGTVNQKLLIWQLDGMYRLQPWLELGVGARLNSLQTDLSAVVDTTIFHGSRSRSASATKTWVDPIIVTRMRFPVERWLFQLKADIGGFGIGSQLTWQLEPDVYYTVSKLFHVGVGYRVLSTDYHSGSGSDYFLYDMSLYGPEIRLGFHF